jgi:putative sigma-54 modulation protein
VVKVTFRHIESTDAIRDYAVEKVEKAAKYLYKDFNAEVILFTEKYWQCAEVVLTGDSHTFVGTARTEDMYAAIDGAMAKVGVQLRRLKDKTHLPDRRTGEQDKPELDG